MGYVTQPRADAANFTLFVIVFFSTVLRLVSRYYVSRKFGLEDLFITLSVAFLFSYTIIIHNENVVTENLYNFLIDLPKEKQIFSMDQLHSYAYFVRLTIFDNSTESTSIYFAKMALLAFYRRASVVKKHILILHCVEAFVTASYIAILLPVFFATSPVSCEYDFVAHFDDPVPCVSNVDTFRLIMAGSGFNILIDLIMVVLPWFVIPKLQLSRANKYKLIAMYSLGFFTIVASAVRIHGINIAGFDIIPKLEAQFTFNFTSMIEASTAIVCVNVPGIFAAFNRFRRSKNKGYTYGSGESGGDNTDGKVTISGGRTKRKTNTQDSEEKTDHNITLTHEFTVSDEESGNASNKEGSSNPV